MEATTLKQKKNDLIKNIGALLADFSNDVGPVNVTIATNYKIDPMKPPKTIITITI